MLINQSRDARLESGDTTDVAMLIVVGTCDQSRDIRPESYLPTRIEHTTGITSFDQSRAYDQSRTYDRSYDILAL
jgi:hypothetical protein